MATDSQSLLDQAKCYLCLGGISQGEALQLALLAQIASSPTIKTARQSVTVNQSSNADVAFVWPTPFPDANYTVAASIVDSTFAVQSMSVFHVLSVAADQVHVMVRNASGATQLTGIVHVIAIHD